MNQGTEYRLLRYAEEEIVSARDAALVKNRVRAIRSAEKAVADLTKFIEFMKEEI